jgi:AcrR family transcriptional regulator
MPRADRLSREDRQAVIIDAAVKLLDRQGFGDITVEMLRQEAGLSKGGFYHHVKSKNDVLLMVCENAGVAMVQALNKAQVYEGTPREQVEVLLGAYLDVVLVYRGALWAFFAERNRLTPDERERVLHWERKFLRGVADMLDGFKASGEVRDVDTGTLTQAFLGMINWVTRWHRKPNSDALRRSLTEIFIDGAFTRDASPK